MRYYSSTFIFDKKESPECCIWRQGKRKGTIYVQFRSEGSFKHATPDISFFLDSEQSLINFKNKVLWAYEEFMKKKKDNKA